jgi:hypothetical protein
VIGKKHLESKKNIFLEKHLYKKADLWKICVKNIFYILLASYQEVLLYKKHLCLQTQCYKTVTLQNGYTATMLNGTIPTEIGEFTKLSEYYLDWCKDVHILILIIMFTWWRSFSRSFQQYIDRKYPFSHWALDKFGYVLSWSVQWLPYFDSNYSVPLVTQLL